MLKTRGVAHFSLPVTDIARAEAFYRDILGMKVLAGSHERGMVFLDSGGDCIILARCEGPNNAQGDKDVHHAFIVDADAYDDSVRFLEENGIEILFQEDRQGGVVNGRRAYFHDPDRNVLEIIDLTSYSGA